MAAGNKHNSFFIYSRRVTHDTHHTWHSDRGGPSHFAPLTFLIQSVVSPLLKICGKMPPLQENVHNLVICPPQATKLNR